MFCRNFKVFPTHCLKKSILLANSWNNKPLRWVRRLFSSGGLECRTLQDVARHLRCGKLQRVVVMAGAGISTSSGIPDFRTPGTGLYDNLQKYQLPYAEAIFSIDHFSMDPKPFFCLAQELYPSGKYRPNIAHGFVKLLHEKGLLHRMYTQNIDGLERLAGIPEEKLVEAHGTFAKATCRVCQEPYEGECIKDSILQGEIPRCTRKLCKGVIKPDIVFFGEMLPERFYLFMTDLPQADLLIIMGTSLEVEPFASIAEATLPGVPRILFNMQSAENFVNNSRRNDILALGDLKETLTQFCEELGWQNELCDLVESFNIQKDIAQKPEE